MSSSSYVITVSGTQFIVKCRFCKWQLADKVELRLYIYLFQWSRYGCSCSIERQINNKDIQECRRCNQNHVQTVVRSCNTNTRSVKVDHPEWDRRFPCDIGPIYSILAQWFRKKSVLFVDLLVISCGNAEQVYEQYRSLTTLYVNGRAH